MVSILIRTFFFIGQTFSPIRHIVVGWAQFAAFWTAKMNFFKHD